MFAEQTLLFAAIDMLAVKYLDEFVRFAKSHPGKFNYGSPGLSTELNLTVEILKQRAGINIVHIGYRGGAPAINALLRNDIQMLPVVPSSIGPFIKSGKVKALATTAPRRLSEFPDIPTTKEQGYPEVNIVPWWGVFVPAGTPQAVIDSLQSAVSALLKNSKYREKLEAMSVEPTAILSRPFSKMLADQTKRWGEVIKKAGLRLQ
jgi:tripartite-type tricarboxylate transporter receptor subunit TctC